MSLEHHPGRSDPTAAIGMDGSARGSPDASDYWQALINEKEAGRFLKLTDRTMQSYRRTGDGPRYIRLSSRCLRYRRIDLREWAEARFRTSTSDTGQASAIPGDTPSGTR
jgi:predicted DNA-binding transcriptional regulator AlpA